MLRAFASAAELAWAVARLARSGRYVDVPCVDAGGEDVAVAVEDRTAAAVDGLVAGEFGARLFGVMAVVEDLNLDKAKEHDQPKAAEYGGGQPHPTSPMGSLLRHPNAPPPACLAASGCRLVPQRHPANS